MKKSLLYIWTWRELFKAQLWPVVAALSLIIACVFTLSGLASRIESALSQQGRSMLAADLVLRSDAPLNDEQVALLGAQDVEMSTQTRFSTMAFSQEDMQLVTVKAVESDYPLRGEMVLKRDRATQDHILPGELWLEERLFSLLNVKLGDEVAIGDLPLKVSGQIISEPALSFNPFNQMPLVMMHQDDVSAAGVIRLGSRASYRYFFTGDDDTLAELKSLIPPAEQFRWIDENSRNRTGDMIERSRNYLSLTVVLVIVMSAVTLQLTCQHYVKSRVQTLAMVKSLGATKAWVVRWLGYQVLMLFAFSIAVGLLLGNVLEYLLRLPLTDVLPDPLPSIGLTPWILAPIVAVLVALPAMGIPLLTLIKLSAVNVFQAQAPTDSASRLRYLLLAIPFGALFLFTYQNLMLWVVLIAIGLMLLLLAAIGIGVLNVIKTKSHHPSLKLALSRVTRDHWICGVQLSSLAISFMLLAIIWLLRTDLLQDWQQTLPEKSPNVFAVNISKEELPSYLYVLDEKKLVRSDAYPIIRGRLVARNGERYADTQPDASNRDNSLRRELNLTWRNKLPPQNEIVAGEWSVKRGVSVESELAERLDLSLGDELTFQINGEEFSTPITSFRQVEWRNMRPNFYFIFDSETVANFPANWLVSFRVQTEQSELINQLGRDFPTVSLLDLRTMGGKIQQILGQISLSLSVLAGLAVISGLLLILTLLRLSMADRQNEIKLYRTLGATKKRVSTTLWAEYGTMALVAGLIAALGAELAMTALVTWGLELSPRLHLEMWLALPISALVLVYLTVNWMLKQLLTPIVKAG